MLCHKHVPKTICIAFIVPSDDGENFVRGKYVCSERSKKYIGFFWRGISGYQVIRTES